MADLRYHLASLAAVFVALAVGVLLGVAISGKVSDTSESAKQSIIDNLESSLEAERERTAAAERQGEAARELAERAYEPLMEDRLEGKEFALVFLGPVSGDVRADVEQALRNAGASFRLTSIDLPLDPAALNGTLDGSAELASYASDSDFGTLGRELGRELVEGGETPLWNALESELVEQRSPGAISDPVDGAIVVRSWSPPETDGPEPLEDAAELRATETLVDGLLDGLDSTDEPIVGVERFATPDEESAIPLYRERGVSSVDDIDTIYGRLALGLVLADGEPGHYGLKDTADALTPPITPVVPEPSAG